MIRQSEQIAELADAFAKAQAKFGKALKDTANPFFKSKYADLAAVIDATLEHLNAEGIGVLQHPSLEYKAIGDGVEAYITVTTRLQHKSGQWQESDLSIPAMMGNKFDAQTCGSAISYACRYAARSICFVPTADDDGNAATGRGSREAAQAEGQKKIEAYKQAKGNVTIQDLEKAIGNVSQEVKTPELTVVQVGVDKYEIAGEESIIDDFRELLAAWGKRVRDPKSKLPVVPTRVVMDATGLDNFKREFCENRHGVLVPLKATWAKP